MDGSRRVSTNTNEHSAATLRARWRENAALHTLQHITIWMLLLTTMMLLVHV